MGILKAKKNVDQVYKAIYALKDAAFQVYDSIPSRLVDLHNQFRNKAQEHRTNTNNQARVAFRRDKEIGYRCHMLSRSGPTGNFRILESEIFTMQNLLNDEESMEV